MAFISHLICFGIGFGFAFFLYRKEIAKLDKKNAYIHRSKRALSLDLADRITEIKKLKQSLADDYANNAKYFYEIISQFL